MLLFMGLQWFVIAVFISLPLPQQLDNVYIFLSVFGCNAQLLADEVRPSSALKFM